MESKVIRLTVSEAARLFGVESKTIRRAIKNNELKYIVVQGRYKINFQGLLEWSQGRTTTKNKLANRGIGQFVDKWKIKNKLYSPDPRLVSQQKNDEPNQVNTPDLPPDNDNTI